MISAARVARCAIQHSVSYCVKIKFYASIQRVSEQFPNCSLVNKFREKSVDVLEVVNFRQQLRRRVLSLAITVVDLRPTYLELRPLRSTRIYRIGKAAKPQIGTTRKTLDRYIIYRTAPLSTTLNDPYPRFQGHAIL